jgi:hypothetical protein
MSSAMYEPTIVEYQFVVSLALGAGRHDAGV